MLERNRCLPPSAPELCFDSRCPALIRPLVSRLRARATVEWNYLYLMEEQGVLSSPSGAASAVARVVRLFAPVGDSPRAMGGVEPTASPRSHQVQCAQIGYLEMS